VVGRIIRPHGLRGELSVEVRTDDPGGRYANGSVLGTDPESGPLTVTASRWHSGRLLVSFAEVIDRTDAELLRGVLLTVDAADVPLPQDPDEFHDHQLTGLTVVTVSGELVGTVSDVLHAGQDLLSITPAAGTSRQEEVLVPFVAAIVTEVDVAAGRLVIDPPPGLLDLAVASAGPDDTDAGPDDTDAGPDDTDAGPGSPTARSGTGVTPGGDGTGSSPDPDVGSGRDGADAEAAGAGPGPGGGRED
jgi:16S rRNA processing protein RimM